MSIGQILAVVIVGIVGGGFLSCAAAVAVADLIDLRRPRWDRRRSDRKLQTGRLGIWMRALTGDRGWR